MTTQHQLGVTGNLLKYPNRFIDSAPLTRRTLDPYVNRSPSVAREIVESPLPSIQATQFRDYYETKDSLGMCASPHIPRINFVQVNFY